MGCSLYYLPLICGAILNYFAASSAVSSAGAVGLMQITPDTFSWISMLMTRTADSGMLYDPETNIEDGTERDTWKVWYKLGKASNSQSETRKWTSVTIDFKQIYDNWETLMNTEPATYRGGANDNWSTSWRALFAVNLNSHGASGVHTTSYYIGNFRIKHV